MKLNSLLLRFIARSSDSLVAFVLALDAKLDAFLAEHDTKVTELENEIDNLYETANQRIAEIEQITEQAVGAVHDEIAKAEEVAKVLGNLKAVLTK